MPRVSNAKEKILEAGKELFWLHNYGSVSVDDICKKAEVNKGSFYHFFSSKADLCVECMENHWQSRLAANDAIFSVTKNPRKRIEDYCADLLQCQTELYEKYGYILGCPVTLTATELGHEEEKIRLKSLEVFNGYSKYFESVIKDLSGEIELKGINTEALSKQIFSYITGLLYYAKISKDLSFLRDNLENGIKSLIGIKKQIT
ncbi:MAG: TetR/AcrR family transcriptional regulator [Candidatus Caenarcaniphilales bacterium]|nr:TetR/AcrR family transcriptional regulator [Candidatus Caenarcaniphilales bacterium]